MIPSYNEVENSSKMPTKTYFLDIENKRISGVTDKLDAMRQALYLILNTERYEYPVFSWNYGAELFETFSNPINFLYPELKRRITEALLTDDRIISIEDFSFEALKGKVLVTFTVKTIFGNIKAEKEVNTNV